MKQHPLVRILALILALILIAGILASPALAGSEDHVVIKLHYHRPDETYDGWSVWFWNYGKDGVDIPFAEEDGDMVATFEVDPGVSKVGFIVKLPGWAQKDVNEDQFIDVVAYTAGTVHVYVESGVKGYELVLGDDVVSGIKPTSVKLREGVGVDVQMTAPVENPSEVFTIQGPNGEVPIASVNAMGSFYTIRTEEALSLYETYTLVYDGNSYKVSMPNVYSTESFEAAFTYEGNDLGATWTKEKTSFRLWAPTATAVTVNLYESGTQGTDDLIETIDMTADVNGTWIAEKEGDLNGVYYTYSVHVGGDVNEACDPYARTTGVNGHRAMIIDLDSTDPEGWENDTDPNADLNMTDVVLYELHVRDLSMDESSGITNKGKYLGVIERGTRNSGNLATGLDHIVDLGITHLHLLPVYDYGSVDESKLDTPQFNWGYDPVNYNVPEGSYSTDPYNGAVRVKEFKQMVQGLHDAGISVVMDVVYNHVHSAGDFCFNKIVPGYFSRINENGSYSNGSGCGNDTATERAMVSKYIVDSVLYWVEEYHIDGFRFDLVGLIDTDTVNAIIEEVHKSHPNVIFYGEGWTMTTNVTKDGYTMATQVNSTETPGFAYFSDNIRDGLKGSVFNDYEKGYASGALTLSGKIESCYKGAPGWTNNPSQIINYASCHDNLSLFDKLTISVPNAERQTLVAMNNLTAAIYMTAQGTPFFQAGEEMLRSKPLPDGTFDHNSYSSPDSVNAIKWDQLSDPIVYTVYEYYKGLIAFRKANPGLRMTTAEEVSQYLTVRTDLDYNVTGFHISAGANGQEKDIFVIFNPNKESTTVTLPDGEWTVYVNGKHAGTEALATVHTSITVDPVTPIIMIRTGDTPVPPPTESPTVVPTETPTQAPTDAPSEPADKNEEFFSNPVLIGLAIVILLVGELVVRFLKKNKQK